jgi:hypothetical protein
MTFVPYCGPSVDPNNIDTQIAQARAYESFRTDFLSRYPNGEVMTELEYIGRTVSAAVGSSGPVQYSGKQLINRLLAAMADAFIRKGYRKPDGLGIAEEGRSLRVELLEVTTAKNQESAKKQMRDKTDTLARQVNESMQASFPVTYVGTPWRPTKTYEMFVPCPPAAKPREVARWVCFLPTQRINPPDGVILYEVHNILLEPEKVAAPKLSEDASQRLAKAYADARALEGTRVADDPVWARQYLQANPPDRDEIRNMVMTVGIALAVVALAAACAGAVADPVPGDEVVVCGVALQVARQAIQ